MKPALGILAPAVVLALALLAATALTVAAPPSMPWLALTGPLLLVCTLLGIDLVRRRRLVPSFTALVMAAGLTLATGIVAFDGLENLGLMMPVLGSCAMFALLPSRATACRACQ